MGIRPDLKLYVLPHFPWLLCLVLFLGSGFDHQLFRTDEPGVQVIVLDAGHGGKDPGNLGTGRYKRREKDIALSVVQKVGALIEANLPGVKVVYTRESDRFVELHGRTAIANRAKADLFVSIHCDAASQESAYGSTTFVMGKDHSDENMRVAMQENSVIFLEDNYEENYEGFDPSKPETYIALTLYQNAYLEQSIHLANLVQEQFRDRAKRRDRGVRQQPLYVTSRTSMPAVLIELGFLTNRSEEDYLNTDNGQDIMASAIFRAVRDYKQHRDELEKRSHPPTPFPNKDQQPVIKDPEPVVEKPSAESVAESPVPEAPKVWFSVQLVTSADKRSTDPANFKGLTSVEMLEENGLYKYIYGKFPGYEEARKAQDEARKLGYQGAFVVGFINGRKASVADALKLVK